mmetsp:Transcript_1403/g.3440  ORF Transcript_1403/g.3440 Transcript_1403/m.3440 type:complete len:236 (+) Transcript_1403:224-931(+)
MRPGLAGSNHAQDTCRETSRAGWAPCLKQDRRSRSASSAVMAWPPESLGSNSISVHAPWPTGRPPVGEAESKERTHGEGDGAGDGNAARHAAAGRDRGRGAARGRWRAARAERAARPAGGGPAAGAARGVPCARSAQQEPGGGRRAVAVRGGHLLLHRAAHPDQRGARRGVHAGLQVGQGRRRAARGQVSRAGSTFCVEAQRAGEQLQLTYAYRPPAPPPRMPFYSSFFKSIFFG